MWADGTITGRVLAGDGYTLGDQTHHTLQPLTAAEALAQEKKWSGWKPVREELQRLEACHNNNNPLPPPPPPPPPPVGRQIELVDCSAAP